MVKQNEAGSTPGADKVCKNLRTMLADLYDAMAEDAAKDLFQGLPSLSKLIRAHKNYGPAARAIVNDVGLSKFFPVLREKGEPERLAISEDGLASRIIWSDGTSEGSTPFSLCKGIVRDAFTYALSWSDEPPVDEVLSRLPNSIKLARDLANNRTVMIPAVTAIHNIVLTRVVEP